MDKYKITSDQLGQSMIYLIGMIPVLVVALLYVYNTNIAVNNKTKLQNSADAVAYSVAVIVARDYNFKAYTNRAMIANQVGIAQSVSLTSWIRYAEQLAKNVATALSVIPKLAAFMQKFKKTIEKSRIALEYVMGGLTGVTRGVIYFISQSQEAFASGTFIIANNIANQVAQANDVDINNIDIVGTDIEDIVFLTNQIAIAPDTLTRGKVGFTRRFSPAEVTRKYTESRKDKKIFKKAREDANYIGSETFKLIIDESLDGFSRNRNELDDESPFRWRGGTSLVGNRHRGDGIAQYDTWLAIDTLDIAFGETPVAWGAAKHTSSKQLDAYKYVSDKQKHTKLGGQLHDNAEAAKKGAEEIQKGKEGEFEKIAHIIYTGSRIGKKPAKTRPSNNFPLPLGITSGLDNFYGLSNQGLITKGQKLRILISKNTDNLSLSSKKNIGSNQLSLTEDGKVNKIYAYAASVPYFSRAHDLNPRDDGAREYANLYNPYWKPRLERMSDKERLIINGIITGSGILGSTEDLLNNFKN